MKQYEVKVLNLLTNNIHIELESVAHLLQQVR